MRRWIPRNFPFIAATLITASFVSGSALGQAAPDGVAAEVKILPNNKVLVVRLDKGTSMIEFCQDERDSGCADNASAPRDTDCSCRLLENRCDFLVVDPSTGEMSEPEPITREAVATYAGDEGLPLTNNPELLPQFKFGQNECNLQTAAVTPGPNNPSTVPTCTHCEEPVSAGQP